MGAFITISCFVSDTFYEMHLYNLTLQRATGITHAVHGNFSGSKMQEILVSRGKSLELLRPDPNTGKVHTLLTVEVFGIIRSLMAFRLTGGTKGRFSFSTFKTFGKNKSLFGVCSVQCEGGGNVVYRRKLSCGK